MTIIECGSPRCSSRGRHSGTSPPGCVSPGKWWPTLKNGSAPRTMAAPARWASSRLSPSTTGGADSTSAGTSSSSAPSGAPP
nr:hypothetical protein [Actinomadura madurae]